MKLIYYIKIIIYLYKIAILHHGMQSFRINRVYCTPVVYCTIADVMHIFVTSRISPAATSISLRDHANERYADRFDV